MLQKFQNTALYLYFFSLSFEMFNLGGLGSTSRFISILYLIAILPDIQSYLRIERISKYIIPWIFLFTYIVIVSVVNLNQYTTWDHLFDTTIFFNILFYWFLINHERKVPNTLIKGFIAFILSSITLTVFYYFGIGVEIEYGRIEIFGDNQNKTGVRLAVAIISIIYLVFISDFIKSKIKYLFLIPLPLMLQFLFDTASRVAFVSLILSFAIMVLFNNSLKPSRKTVVIILLGLFSVIYGKTLYLKSEVLASRMSDIDEKGVTNSRDMVWDNALNIISSSPIFGVGKSGYVEKSILFSGRNMSPHNVILEVWALSGIIGLFVFSLFMYRIIKASYTSFKIDKFMLPMLLLIPVVGQILTGQILGHKLYWAIFALCVSSIFYLKQKRI